MAIFYVNANADPGGDGTTTATTGTHCAWDSVSDVNGATFSADDQILFNRGDTFAGVTLAPPSSGTSGHPIVFGAYGTGARPIITGTDNDGVLSTAARSYLKFEHINFGDCGIYFLSADRYGIEIDDCVNDSVPSNAVFFTRTDGITITDCSFTNVGNGGIVFYGEVGQGFGCTNGTVSGCTITGTDHSDGITVHPDDTLVADCGDNWVFSNNTISGFGEQGLDIGKAADAIGNVQIIGNDISDNLAGAMNVGLDDGSIISRNWIHNEHQHAIYLGNHSDDVTIAYNIISKCIREVLTTTNTAEASVSNISVLNNVIYTDATLTRNVVYIRANANVSGFTFKNNVVYQAANAGTYIIQIETDTVTQIGGVFDYNIYYPDNGGTGAFDFRDGSGAFATFAAWQSTYSQEAHSSIASPSFVNAGGSYDLETDFQISGAPCQNAGASVGETTDYWGNAVGLVPDIGVYEIAAVAPTVTTTAESSVLQTTATSGGNVTAQGDALVSRGVCWAETENPTTSNDKTTDGTGAGEYASSITGLTAGTTYHVRAYATNTAGTSYGADNPLTTLDNPAITSLSDTTVLAGQSITITGTNFGAVEGTVEFNGSEGTVSAWADTEITVTAPSPLTAGDVVVYISESIYSAGSAYTMQGGAGGANVGAIDPTMGWML